MNANCCGETGGPGGSRTLNCSLRFERSASANSATGPWCPRQDLNLHALRHPLLRRARLPFRHGDKLWWVSRDLNSEAPREHSVLQTGATNRIRLTPKLWRKRRDSNSHDFDVATLAGSWDTITRRFRTGTGATIRTPCFGFGIQMLSQEHTGIKLEEGS